ncbi:DNA primase/polymerase, bifunctional, N-terminal [uncultured Caudovirales phage]|uniref:DNA primase/polymerase, bifunctional, N-terminal n=1 Tax=uncultured Caudovirales phage TaxID=2100421 RepID=A0A6J5MJN1_9CAUD|nr:DNA primase/polymerase, bifunctional, N-terminal [uncultured Caudovirales phage]CAB4178073.1 DNA primase/polymerase, bifunctional, N-terminal [uncultured Caudovirales phage]CAB4187113.1 DNA primase/polymerase, bifunctional, N-terminal [uncultured Caudovirales phage]CAB4218823.1 DNA primase/polymerase, bifunctional, N-terminal [uncultured Caudovirales phage]
MPLGTPQQVFALRQQLWDAGFRPVPIYSPDAQHNAAGKAPRGADWGDKARLDPPAATVQAPSLDALNTGILCDGLRAIDIDIDNPTIAHSIRAKCFDMFGETAMRYRTNSPRALLVYRAAEGAPPKRVLTGTFGKVEVLGRGQQFVGFGVHPSGADLQWMPDALGDISVDQLQAVTEDEITAFLEACAPSVGADPKQTKERGEHQPNQKLGADALQVVAALSAIPNSMPADWEAWNRIGMATWAATNGGEAGRAAFHAWSQQHPAYSADETNARWDHYAESPPTQIGAGTLFYLAKGAQAPEEAPQQQDAPRTGIPILYWNEITPSYDVNDFIEGLLIREAMSVAYGQSNSGKTFFMSDAALRVAAGMKWRDREVEQGAVIWLAMEGAMGIRNRIEAWKRENGMEDATLPFAVVPVALNLLDPDADTSPLITLIQEAARRMEMPVAWVIVDTLSRAIAGGNENSPEDMGALVTNGTKIQQTIKAHITWIHHSGKDDAKGARGHSLLRAATDTEIEIVADGSSRCARVTKQREMEGGGEFPFTLRVVELAQNKRGKPVTSCVVDHDDGPAIKTRVNLDGHKKRAFEVLVQAVASSGRAGEAGVPSGFPSVPEKWWRDRWHDSAMPGAEYEAKKKAFQRASAELVNARIVGMNAGRVWVVYQNGGENG